MSFEQGYLDRDYPFKQQATQGFNKGFKDNFIGQKFIGVSRNSPYITRSNENTVLFSNPTDSASFKNGYRDFNVNSYKDIDHSTGGITKIIEWAGNLLSVHSHGINVTGVNDQAVLNTQAGQSVKIGTVDVLADKVTNVSEEFGSTWLRSVCRSDNFVYGIDANHGKIWATNGQDVKVISMGVNKIFSTFIQDFKGTTEIPGKLYINSYFDPIKSEVIFTLYNSNSDLTYGETIANLDPDMVELFKSMTPAELDTWITEGVDQDEQIERRKQVDTFNYFRSGTIVKHLTLIYAESTGTWTTRLSYSPEFMFSIGSSTYSINNKEQVIDGQRLNGTDHGTLNNRHLIWEHGSAYKDIPIYGSYYGDEPLFELAYCVNAEPENEKILQKIEVIGSESKPTSVEYLTSEDAPWVHRLVDPTGYSYTDWNEIVTEFNSKMLEGTREIVNPARWYTQEIYDRRSAPVFRSNYIYVGGKNEIKVARGIRSMYNFTTDPTSKIPYMVTNMTDKYFHVKLVYNSGEIVYIKEINSLFKTLLNG
jgi:hypothetical protein